ncbi:MAG: hypothetical protein K2P18_01395 [Oscillospiraceae bacterium]|nr:hypothetical protein [Oscillospiraceae bacterium]
MKTCLKLRQEAKGGGNLSEQKKYIKFIDSGYKVLFYIPDGGRIRITHTDGKQFDHVCRYIDEYHTAVGNNHFHICEFAERMERIGAKYRPLDYIQEPNFYPRYFFAASENGPGPVYRILDTWRGYGFAFAPNGATRGQKYCIFKLADDGSGHHHVSCVIQWSGNLKDIAPQDWGFDLKLIKAVTQKANAASRKAKRTRPER